MAAKRALICSYYVPQPDLDSSSRRLHHFVRFLLEEGWEVTAAAKNPVHSRRPARALGRLGVPVYTPIGPELLEVIEQRRFDVAILAFWYVAEVLINEIRRSAPATTVIVDSMDLHFLRHARHTFNPSLAERPTDALGETFAWETTRELNAYGAADGVLAVSQKEAELVSDLMADPALGHAVPDCEDLAASPLGFADRRGMLFIGNFEHLPNVDAVTYLCEEVVPRLNPALLAEHPLTIVGNDSEMLLRMPGVDHPHVHVVGWVPSVIPYLERTRISLIPLLYGAGTKRKLIQSLMIQTPAVTTTVGIEGLDLRHEEQVLIADDPAAFANAIETLLNGPTLWHRLATNGRRHILASRGRDVSRTALLDAVAAAQARSPKHRVIPVPDHVVAEANEVPSHAYQGLIRRIRRLVRQTLPADAKVIVISRGDPDLLDLDGRVGWHYPQDEKTGQYAGFHPEDSEAAIEHLEALRRHGGEFFLVPSTDSWWLEHYREFGLHLESRFERLADQEETCVIFDLRTPVAEDEPEEAAVEAPVEAPAATTVDGGPAISVVIPTFNRAELLEESLSSLANQSLPKDRFEVIVVDDGSTDATAAVCDQLMSQLPLRRHRLERSGIAAAKNAGALASTGSILLFFDDDDVADRDLLLEHVRAHDEHPEENVAVLGYTGWAPSLTVTEVMHFVTDVGHYLFSYDGLMAGEELDFTYFWGGRTSCKRSFAVTHGLFRPEFTFGSEDIELAYRLAEHGLRVIYWPRAAQYMNRPVTYDEFCGRCERQGISQWMFSRMHSDQRIQEYCGIAEVRERWRTVEPELEERRARAAEIERQLADNGADDDLRRQLWDLYWWTFDASKLKGIAEGMRADERPITATA